MLKYLMNTTISLSVGLILPCLLGNAAQATEENQQVQVLIPKTVQVEWQDPDSYRDVRAQMGSNQSFRENVFKQLEKHLHKVTKKLPEGQVLHLTVTDVDLAGQVWPGSFYGLNSANDVRIVKAVDFPRIRFNYQLKEHDVVVKEGEENIKDMSFQQRSNRLFKSDPLRYEKALLERWIREFILPKEGTS